MKCFLSDMPELRLGLNDKLEDVTFHQCVNLSTYEAQKVGGAGRGWGLRGAAGAGAGSAGAGSASAGEPVQLQGGWCRGQCRFRAWRGR
jgi:hypothetical protein